MGKKTAKPKPPRLPFDRDDWPFSRGLTAAFQVLNALPINATEVLEAVIPFRQGIPKTNRNLTGLTFNFDRGTKTGGIDVTVAVDDLACEVVPTILIYESDPPTSLARLDLDAKVLRRVQKFRAAEAAAEHVTEIVADFLHDLQIDRE